MKNSANNRQLTAMAGEFLTVGKLFKLGYQASITFGNAKAIDILVYNPDIKKTFSVQVKTLRGYNCFNITKQNIIDNFIYVFVVLHEFNQQEEFFIVPGSDIISDFNKFFGSSYRNAEEPSVRPAINFGPLKAYKNNWTIFKQGKGPVE
jgi:hypothetical protein